MMIAIAQARFAEETTETQASTEATGTPETNDDAAQPGEMPAHDLDMIDVADGAVMYECRRCGMRRANSSYGLTSQPCAQTQVRLGRPPRQQGGH